MNISKSSIVNFRVIFVCVALWVFILLLAFSCSTTFAAGIPDNGTFDTDISGWTLTGDPCGWIAGGYVGGGLEINGCSAVSDSFTMPAGAEISFWLTQNDCWLACWEERKFIFYADCDSGVFGSDVGDAATYFNVGTDLDWKYFTIDASGASGDSCEIHFRESSTWSHWRIDEIVITAGVYSGATSTPSGGGGGDPTATLPPSSTPLPTNTPAPTGDPISGGGSGGLCPPTDPCYVIVENTPLPVDLIGVGGTPVSAGGGIPIQGGNSTPVVVAYATVAITPISGSSAGVSVSAAVPVYSSGSSSGVIPIASAGGSVGVGDIVDVGVEENTVSGCLPAQVAQVVNVGENGCVSFPVKTLTEYKLLGVNLAPFFLVIAGVMFMVFIIRQLQEK